MDLDKLKNTWQSLDKEAKKQEALSTEKINRMIQSKYRSRLHRIIFPEIIITGVFLYFVVLLVFRFGELDTNLLACLGIGSIVVLIVLPLLRLIKLFNLYQLSNPNKPYSESIKQFATLKIRFQKLQQFNFILGFVLMMSLIILSTKIYHEYDVTQSKYFWGITLSVSLAFMAIFNHWITKRFNQKMKEAEELLKELNTI